LQNCHVRVFRWPAFWWRKRLYMRR
jgi:hypothetical protein